MFRMQVKMKDAQGNMEWKDVHPTGGPAYEYETKQEAMSMLQMCYPDSILNEQVRVKEEK